MATESVRRLAGRIGAHTRWANEPDRKAALEPARRGFMARFEREVDPDNVLEPAERARRADHAMKAHMSKMALSSAKRRAEKRK